MNWFSVKFVPHDNQRILTFSPVYKVGDVMRFRIMDSQFLKLCKEVTHWCALEDYAPKEDYEEIGDPLPPESGKETDYNWLGELGYFMD